MLEMPSQFRFAGPNKEYEWEMWAVQVLISRLAAFQKTISATKVGGETLWSGPIPVVSAYRRLGTTVPGDECGKTDATDGTYGHWKGFSADVNLTTFIDKIRDKGFEGDTDRDKDKELDKYLAKLKLGRPFWRQKYTERNHMTVIEHPRCKAYMAKIGNLPIKYKPGFNPKL